MTTDATENLLRSALRAHVDDAGDDPGSDPWVRVARAHRRSRRRRLTLAAGALTAVVAVTGGLAGTQPWTEWSHDARPADHVGDDGATRPGLSWLKLDDGVPRGALGDDPALRQAVVTELRRRGAGDPHGPQLTRPDTVHVLWGGVLENKQVALVRAVQAFDGPGGREDQDVLIWLTGPPGGGPMTQLSLDTDGPPIKALPYLDQNGDRRLLAVVRRTATVMATRTVITPDRGELERSFRPVPVEDGVVDVPVPDPAGRGPVLLKEWSGPTGKTTSPGRPKQATSGYASSAVPFSPSSDSAPPNGLSETRRQVLSDGARGPGLPWPQTSAALDSVITQFWSDAAHTDPRVEWAGPVPAARGGGTLVVTSARFAGQGKVLVIERKDENQQDLWHFVKTVPAGETFDIGQVSAWRLPVAAATGGKRQVVVWAFGPDTRSVDVTVNGRTRPGTLQDGVGWLEVDPGDLVTVTARRDAGGDAELLLDPDHVEPVRAGAPLFGADWPDAP